MSQSLYGLQASFTAGADLSALQYRVVTLDTGDMSVKKCGTSDTPIGVLQNAPASAGAASVRTHGTSKVEAAGGFSKGDHLVVADADGRVDTATAIDYDYLTETAVYVVGIALEAAGQAGDVIEMLIRPFERTA